MKTASLGKMEGDDSDGMQVDELAIDGGFAEFGAFDMAYTDGKSWP